MYNFRITIILLLMAIASRLYGGADCNAKEQFLKLYPQTSFELRQQKCVQIDVSASYDSAGVDVVFKWDLGDGATATGLKFRHCYEEFGLYFANLHILSIKGDTLSLNELTLEVMIKEAVQASLIIPDTLNFNQELMPKFSTSDLFTYKIEHTYFDFGDGNMVCRETSHKYDIPGTYIVKMLLELSNEDGLFYLKAEKKIFVEGYNICKIQLTKYFEEHIPNPINYLDEPIRYSLVRAIDQKVVYHTEFTDDLYCQFTPLGADHWLCIWKGSQLMQPCLIPAVQDSAESFKHIAELVGKNLNRPPLSLLPVFFSLNESKPDHKNRNVLKKNIKLLQSLPYVTLSIGSHTHTGGMRGISERYSIQRSSYLFSEIYGSVGDGVEIRIDDPNEVMSLINSCFDDPECGNENKLLNGRSDLKIVAIGKI
jgi:hypothetical protein